MAFEVGETDAGLSGLGSLAVLASLPVAALSPAVAIPLGLAGAGLVVAGVRKKRRRPDAHDDAA